MKIYLIKDGEGRCKIGYSKDPSSRLKQLQTGGATEYQLIHEVECKYATKVEKAIHRMLNTYHANGEWFNLPVEKISTFPELVRKVENNFKVISENSTLNRPF